MAADSTIDLIVNQKASFRATFFLKNNLNAAVDLTGYTVCARYNTAIDAPESTAAEFTTSIPTPANGGIIMELAPIITEFLDPTIKYFYDVVITEIATGFKNRVIQGAMKVSAGVTPYNC